MMRLRLSIVVLVCWLLVLRTQGIDVPLTVIQSAVAKGAVCLDGSPPAYHFHPGNGTGANNWLVFIEGGGWCETEELCLQRTKLPYGSSKLMEQVMGFSGMLAHEAKYNPDFYNWNRVKVRYCDGSSFTGDVEDVNPKTKLFYRGGRVFKAIMEELMAKGMKNAQNAILSGCSAGGLATLINCEKFRALFPPTTKVKCVSDAGYFINAKDVGGGNHAETVYAKVVALHGSAKNLAPYCTAKMKPELCFFPQNFAAEMKTPVFLINSPYDSSQVKNSLAPGVVDKKGEWNKCKLNIKDCTPAQVQILQRFRLEFLQALTQGGGNLPTRGYFINSCYDHCQTGSGDTWYQLDYSPVVAKSTMAKAVGDWYYERKQFKEIDCPYPCNPTCHHRVYNSTPSLPPRS